ncbi:MAG TPA: HNH endonuclease [Mycobacteriales bacterium]|jgi:5-methylcytosine-specific restriction endonuclease McrA
MARALLLNASYEPLCVVPTRRAVVLVLTAKAVVLEAADRTLHSERLDLAEPVVIRLTRYVRVPYRSRAPLSRQGVLARDGHRCQYCGNAAETLDHVVPRSRGGRHVWENLVAACRRCNHVKADRTLDELGWTLRSGAPAAPRGAARLLLGHGRYEPAWAPFLGLAEAASA